MSLVLEPSGHQAIDIRESPVGGLSSTSRETHDPVQVCFLSFCAEAACMHSCMLRAGVQLFCSVREAPQEASKAVSCTPEHAAPLNNSQLLTKLPHRCQHTYADWDMMTL